MLVTKGSNKFQAMDPLYEMEFFLCDTFRNAGHSRDGDDASRTCSLASPNDYMF